LQFVFLDCPFFINFFERKYVTHHPLCLAIGEDESDKPVEQVKAPRSESRKRKASVLRQSMTVHEESTVVLEEDTDAYKLQAFPHIEERARKVGRLCTYMYKQHAEYRLMTMENNIRPLPRATNSTPLPAS